MSRMKNPKLVFRCEECNGTNVKLAVWFDPNANKALHEDPPISDPGWCNDCESEQEIYTRTEESA